MPIKGLTDTASDRHGLPEIARLYKGDEKPEAGNRPGKDLDYFRVEFEPQFEDLRTLFVDLYGETPTEFPRVFFAGETVEEVFATWKEEWTATALLHRCDGEFQVTHYSAQTGYYSRAKVECAAISGEGCQCKQIGRLALLLPDLIDGSGILGTVTVSTHSLNDILTVHRYLVTIQRMYGTLAGVPFRFGRSKSEISVPKTAKDGQRTGQRMNVKKSLFFIHVTPDFTQERLLPTLGSALPVLPAPVEEPQFSPKERPRLGNGDKPRRISGPMRGEREPSIFDAKTWTEFLVYAKTRFGFDEDDCLRALEAVGEVTLETPDQYLGSKDQAAAALVAAHCEYDAKAIGEYTSTKYESPDYGLLINGLAIAIAKSAVPF